MNLIKNLFKNYYRQISSEVIIQSKKATAGSASPHIYQLLGARFAFLDESDQGAQLNEGTVKTITGGSAITARPLYSDPVTFEPTFQVFLLTNHKPEINVNPSLERRLVLIPFLAEFKEEPDPENPYHRKKDPELEAKLNKKLDEFLVWIVNGSVKYFKEGLGQPPDTIKKATNEYIKENDDLSNFLEENYEKDVLGFVYHKQIYESFIKTYAGKKISPKSFTNMMKEKGFILLRKADGRGFKGIKAKEILI